MSRFSIIPPYLKERLDLIKAFGIKKFVLSLIVTTLECTVIFLILYALMSIFVNYPVLGAVILSTLFVIGTGVASLICWKKRKNKRDGNKEKNL